MIWRTTDYKGNEQIWYSEDEYEILRQENQEAKEIIAELENKLTRRANDRYLYTEITSGNAVKR